MKHLKLIAVFVFCSVVLSVKAQDTLNVSTAPTDSTILANEVKSVQLNDTLAVNDSASVTSNEEASTDTTNLLPKHYLFTQRWLWGENGYNRRNGKYPLTYEGRMHEMDIRANLNKWHRIAGYTALAGMLASGITGQMSANGNQNAKNLHSLFTGVTNIAYFGSLGLALFSPPPIGDREKGFTSVNVHRYLAILHVASMITTDILSGMIESNRKIIPYHRAAAITAFSSLFLATVAINL